jgi:hypothetical protein
MKHVNFRPRDKDSFTLIEQRTMTQYPFTCQVSFLICKSDEGTARLDFWIQKIQEVISKLRSSDAVEEEAPVCLFVYLFVFIICVCLFILLYSRNCVFFCLFCIRLFCVLLSFFVFALFIHFVLFLFLF